MVTTSPTSTALDIAGTKGADLITGHDGNDTIQAGLGRDTVFGGQGNDLIIGDTPEVSFKTDVLQMAQAHKATVTFDFEGAGYRNTLGVYKVNPTTGVIGDVKVIWENASLNGSGGDLLAGKSTYDLDLQAGDQIGFFLVGNGFSSNNFKALGAGDFKFVDAAGKPATLDTPGAKMVHVSTVGKVTAINGPTYHTAAFGPRAKLNSDGIEHTMGYMKGTDGKVQIGFEDLWKGGDRDFDDAVFTVDIGAANAQFLNAHVETVLKPATDLSKVSGTSYFRTALTEDLLSGGAGDDTLFGMQGNDLLAGGKVGSEWSLLNGTWTYNPKAALSGVGFKPAEGDDKLIGGTGNDVLLAGRGNDMLEGGDGNDTLNAGLGNDQAFGDSGNDVLNLEGGSDYGEGGEGNDVINAGDGDDVAFGGGGNDSLRGGLGNDQMSGGEGKDELFAADGDDILDGGADDDKLFGGTGNDTLKGGDGNDLMDGGDGDDVLDGGTGKDTLMGGAGSDALYGGAGDDKLFGNVGRDSLRGGDGHDTLDGGEDDDVLDGGTGRDRLTGGAGADRLDGGADKDTLAGGAGSDTLGGDAGNDQLWGGNWAADGTRDVFMHRPGAGRDTVMDFEITADQIDLSAYDLSYSDLAARMVEKNGMTEINLSGLPGTTTADVMVLKAVKAADLTEDKFIL